MSYRTKLPRAFENTLTVTSTKALIDSLTTLLKRKVGLFGIELARGVFGVFFCFQASTG